MDEKGREDMGNAYDSFGVEKMKKRVKGRKCASRQEKGVKYLKGNKNCS